MPDVEREIIESIAMGLICASINMVTRLLIETFRLNIGRSASGTSCIYHGEDLSSFPEENLVCQGEIRLTGIKPRTIRTLTLVPCASTLFVPGR